jgi:hypothetical protein
MITTYIGENVLATALRVKLMKVLYIIKVGHLYSILRGQADTSRVAGLSYLEGTLPVGGELVCTLLGKYEPKHQVIRLELAAMYEPLVIAP